MEKIYILFIVLLMMMLSFTGCDGSSTGQSAFYHNNQEHRKWVNNPSHKPSNVNPNTGHKLFY